MATRLERAGDFASRAGSLRPEDKNVRRGLHAVIAITVALSMGLVVVAALGDYPDVDWRFRPASLLLAALGLLAVLVANAEIWRRLLAALGPELEPLRGLAVWSISALGRYVPSALLMPLLRVAFAEREGVPKRICLASIVYELVLYATAALLVGAYFVIDLPDLQDDPQRFAVLILPLLALALLHPRLFGPLANRALVRVGRDPLPQTLPEGRVLEFVALYAITFVAAGMSLYALSQSVYPVGAGDLPTMVGAFAVGTTLSLIAFMIPGGLVAREAGIVVALSPVMPTAPAIAVAVLARIGQMALELLLASVAPVLARRRQRVNPSGAPSP